MDSIASEAGGLADDQAEPSPAPNSSPSPSTSQGTSQGKRRLVANSTDTAQDDRSLTPMGAALEPVLRQACDDRLGQVNWFRTDWQRGGALTGYATWRSDDGSAAPVVVKLPVGSIEQNWLLRLQIVDHLVPRIHAHGQQLGPYDMAWLVMERLPFGPLGTSWGGKEFDMLIAATGLFYKAASIVPVTGEVPTKDWHQILEEARRNVTEEHDLPHEQRWKSVLKNVRRKLGDWLKAWDQRPCQDWCHGDLHLGNAMSREPAPGGAAVLLDFALTHPGHWVEDAVYFEHIYWSRRQRLGDRKLCSMIAQERKRHGLKVDADWPRLASIKRALLAMSTPAQLNLDGGRPHVAAALEVLEVEAR